MTFEGGAVGLAEESWTKPGGMDDRAEVFGSEGQAYADVLYGNALRAFSTARLRLCRREGRVHGGLVVPDLRGDLELRLPAGDGALRRLRPRGTAPRENGQDGRAVVEAIHALYASAARGRRVELPFASEAARPIDHWKPAGATRRPR